MAGADNTDKAVQEYRFLVNHTQDLGEMALHMKTLRRLFMEMQLYDRAWCVTSALAFLRKTDPEEQQFFEQYRPKGFVRARARLTEELWQKNIYHPDEDRFISHIFATVSSAVAAAYAKEHKDWGLKRKDRRDVQNDQLLFSKVFNYLVQVMGVPQPELYLRPESPGELDLANAREKAQLIPSFVVGASLLQGRPEKELAYVTGKKLTFMRPDHFVRWPTVVPTLAQLRVVFLAALKLSQPAFTIKPDLAQPVSQYLDLLRRLVPPQMLEQLTVVVQRFIASKAGGRSDPLGHGGGLHGDARRIPDVQRSRCSGPTGTERAGRGRGRRTQGQDPGPTPMVDLRRVLHRSRASWVGHWLTRVHRRDGDGAIRQPRSGENGAWLPC